MGRPARFPLPAAHGEGARRAALAEWIADPRNPLTWRVIVNRVWQHHFGRGLCETPSDLGRMGAQPSHPELLDWLAADFRDRGQSLKALHRLIVTSAAYRQSSQAAPAAVAADAGNALLARQARRRLDAEAIRDRMLAAAGALDLTMGGPGFRDFVVLHPEHSPHYEYALARPDDPAALRRSVYRFSVRSRPQPFLATFDCADPSLAVERRGEAINAPQALALKNGALTMAMAKRLADRAKAEAGAGAQATPEAQATAIWRHALARDPAPAELPLLAEHLRRHGAENLARLALNLNEFLFVD